jgi:hypothetical protein
MSPAYPSAWVVAILGVGGQLFLTGLVAFAAWRLWRRPVRLLFGVLAAYLLAGIVYGLGGLYCYNVRNWELCGGFSLPALYFPAGIVFDLVMWPVYVWANLINGFGAFGDCRL